MSGRRYEEGRVELPPDTALPAEPVPVFDIVAKIVRHELDVPVALVSLVSEKEQVFPGADGLSEPWATERSTPLSHSFCQHVVTSGAPLVVENAHDVPLVAHNLAILELGVIAYAGVPVRRGDHVVGALCAIDHRPRRWTGEELTRLTAHAERCSAELARP
jgi:GAF domain-containing protein